MFVMRLFRPGEEGEGGGGWGYCHPSRELARPTLFGQFRYADYENRCNTEKYGTRKPLFHVQPSFSSEFER